WTRVDPIFGGIFQSHHRVHQDGNRRANIEDDRPGIRAIRNRCFSEQQLAEVRNRQRRAAQVPDPEQRRWALRDPCHGRQTDHFPDVPGSQGVKLAADVKSQKASGIELMLRLHALAQVVCCCMACASDAISSMAAARSSAPRDCWLDAVAASREAVLACSAAEATSCAACAISVVAARTLSAPSRMDLLAMPSAVTSPASCSRLADTIWFFCTSPSAAAVICCRSPLRMPIWSRMPRTVSLAPATLVAASRARLRMSLDTTANPRPDSPARAASTEPLTASMLVWTATKAMVSTIFSILRATPSMRVIVVTPARVSASAVDTPRMRLSTDCSPSLSAASRRSTR